MVLGILGYLVFKDWGITASQPSGTSQDGNGYPGILSIQGLGCYSMPAIRGHPWMVLGILGHLVFKDWGGWAGLPQGISQDGYGYPGILSIRGLGCSGRPAIRGHSRMILGIQGYLVFKDWGVTAGQPSGDIPGWYWVSWDT